MMADDYFISMMGGRDAAFSRFIQLQAPDAYYAI